MSLLYYVVVVWAGKPYPEGMSTAGASLDGAHADHAASSALHRLSRAGKSLFRGYIDGRCLRRRRGQRSPRACRPSPSIYPLDKKFLSLQGPPKRRWPASAAWSTSAAWQQASARRYTLRITIFLGRQAGKRCRRGVGGVRPACAGSCRRYTLPLTKSGLRTLSLSLLSLSLQLVKSSF